MLTSKKVGKGKYNKRKADVLFEDINESFDEIPVNNVILLI